MITILQRTIKNPKITYFLTNNFTRSQDKSKEYVHKAFMQALEKIEGYDSTKSALQTWITKIAINIEKIISEGALVLKTKMIIIGKMTAVIIEAKET